MSEMTVIEFVEKHCAANDETDVALLNQHVNAIIAAVIARNAAIWKATLDSDGRASLIWLSLPEPVWEGLLAEGAQIFLEIRRGQ